MGTWAPEAFGNDTACDWAYGLADRDDLALVASAITAVLAYGDGSVPASAAEEALAAIETIARLRGQTGYQNAYTENVDAWVVRTQLQPRASLVKDALTALDLILGEHSELRALWSEDDPGAWLATVEDLRARIRAEPQALVRPAPVDPVNSIINQLKKIQFQHVALTEAPAVALLYNAILASGGLCDAARTRELIAQIWLPLATAENESILWDLAVREAQTWASQAYVDQALAQLEVWRCSPAITAAGLFEYRATSVCLAGGDIDRARTLYVQAIEACPDDLARQFDLALLEARLGDVERAQQLVKKAGQGLQNLPRLFVDLLEGIIAQRLDQAQALDLLTAATSAFTTTSQQNVAAWSVLSYCCGWWALALHSAGKHELAVAAVQLIEPILIQPHHQALLTALRGQKLLADGVSIPELPLPSAAAQPTIAPASALADHGSFKTLRMRGVNALKKIELLRTEFEHGSRLYPFLIGDAAELSRLLASITPPQDGGRAHLAAARHFDVLAWLQEKMPKPVKSWPKKTAPVLKTPMVQFDVASQRLKPELLIGLVELDHPSELFSRIGYGGWNDCPAPHIHTALHGYWQQHYGAQALAVSDDTVECVVTKPPTEKAAALNLGREQHAYCYDIVAQGAGTTAKLGSSLLAASYWHFWWD